MSESLALKVCREEVCKAGAVSPVAKKNWLCAFKCQFVPVWKIPSQGQQQARDQNFDNVHRQYFLPFR